MYWLWLAFWVQCVWLATRIGKRKGEATGAFFIAVILGPVGVLVALASSGRRKSKIADHHFTNGERDHAKDHGASEACHTR